MAPTQYKGAFKLDAPAVGSNDASIRSPLFVLNADAKTATNTPTNVQQILAGAHASHDSIRVVANPRSYTLLNVGLALYRSDRAVALSGITAPVVNIFGLCDNPHSGQRMWPTDVDTDFVDIATATEGLWSPISGFNHTLGTVGVTLDVSMAAIQYSAAGANGADWALSDFCPLPLDGARKVIAALSTALIVTGASKGMVVGYFSSPSV